METVTKLVEVRSVQTRGGNVRFVARDADGREYTTFREEIGGRARQLEGASVRITYHEEQRGRYTNVYLDAIEAVESDATRPGSADGADAQEAAWRTAVEAAPWLVGEPQSEVSPQELYEKLKPFEERVARDIERERRHTAGEE
jgi:hypothetical protein